MPARRSPPAENGGARTRRRLGQDRIMAVLMEAQAGADVDELCARTGISRRTFYRWKARYGGRGAAQALRLQQLEEENARLKQLVAELTLDNRVLRDLLAARL